MRSDRPRYKYEMHENLEKMFRSPTHFELPHALKPGCHEAPHANPLNRRYTPKYTSVTPLLLKTKLSRIYSAIIPKK